MDTVSLLTPMYGVVDVEIIDVGSLRVVMSGDPLVMAAVQVLVFKSGEMMILNDIEKDANRLFELISFDCQTNTAKIRKRK